MTVLEALAAGTPVVNSSGSEINLADSAFALTTVAPGDTSGIKRAVTGFSAEPPNRAHVRALDGDFTWDRIAQRVTPSIKRLYTGP